MTESTVGPANFAPYRGASLVLSASALGEIGVGMLLLPFPQVAALLLDASLDATGLLLARGLGSAALALGLTWWMSRNDTRAIARCAAGFVIYNLVVGAVFAFQALHAERPVLPWLVGIVHLVAGGAFVAAMAHARSSGSSRSSGRSAD